MKAVLCGFGRAGMECLMQWLTDRRFRREDLFVCTHEHPQNAGFLDFLKHLKMPHTTVSVNDCLDELTALAPDLLVSVYYRHVIRSPVLDLVGGRAVNLHPSLLPDYRGCYSSVWAILNGERETGITFHYMTQDVDGGPILLQKKMPIEEADTAFSLYHKLISQFVMYFREVLNRVLDGDRGVPQTPQGLCRYYPRAVPHNGQLVCSETTREYARRFVRAMYFPPYPPARFVTSRGATEAADETALEALSPYWRVDGDAN